MNEIRIFSRFTNFQSFSFYFLIFRHAQTYFSAIHYGLLISNITLYFHMHNTNKIPTQKGIYTYKTDFNQHRFTFFISKAPTFELHTFCTIFTTRLNSKIPFHPHFTYFHRRIFTLALLLLFCLI